MLQKTGRQLNHIMLLCIHRRGRSRLHQEFQMDAVFKCVISDGYNGFREAERKEIRTADKGFRTDFNEAVRNSNVAEAAAA